MIDKDKLMSEIEKRIISIRNCPFKISELGDERHTEGMLAAYEDMLFLIDSMPEKPISDDLQGEIHNKWEDDPHTKWPKCPYEDFKNIALYFANWQREWIMEHACEGKIYKNRDGDVDVLAVHGNTGNLYRGDTVKVIKF